MTELLAHGNPERKDLPKPDEPEPNRQYKPSVLRKIFGRSADLRPCQCSWVDQANVFNPLGLEAFAYGEIIARVNLTHQNSSQEM